MTVRDTVAVTTTATNIDFNADGGGVLVQLTGAASWDGTVDFKATIDGATYYNVPYLNRASLTPGLSVAQISSPSTATLYYVLGPLGQVRIACGAGTTGTLTVVYRTIPDDELLVGMVQGLVPHDAVDAGNPIEIGGYASATPPTSVTAADRVRAWFDLQGALAVLVTGTAGDIATVTLADADAITAFTGVRALAALYGEAPDGLTDRMRSAGDVAPGLGALNVAPIGGDLNLRASAVAGEASGTSTALDNLGWVRAFNAMLDVTVVPTGGSPTLDVYIQTQLASADWQDIAHFTQKAAVGSEILTWGPVVGNVAGTQAEGAAVTVDNYFAEQDAALTATTIRLMQLGDSLRVKWVFAAGGSTGDFTFAVYSTFRS